MKFIYKIIKRTVSYINTKLVILFLYIKRDDFKTDKKILVNLWGEPMFLPLNHRLPLYLFMYKNYSVNLRRIASYIKNKYDKYTAVDIGANIGDSTILMRQGSNARVVCIEGDKNYIEFLKLNLKDIKDKQIIQAFVSEKNSVINGKLVKTEGTGSVVTKKIGTKLVALTLDKIVTKHKIDNVKLLKIDTDGFDGKILRGAKKTILDNKPVIFFEFYEEMYNKAGDSTYKVFKYLYKMNYHTFLVYDNFGNLKQGIKLEQSPDSKEFCKIFNYRNLDYYDLVAFHTTDLELYKYSLIEEKKFYKK